MSGRLFSHFSNNAKGQSSCLLYSTKTANETIKALPFEAIPGPKHYKILGPLNYAINIGDSKNLHKTIHKMHDLYGPIFRIKLGKIDSIFTSSSEHMRGIFRYEGKYPKHPLPPAWLYFNKKFNCKRGLFFMDDNEWLRYRKILNPMLLQNFNHYKPAIETACDKLIDGINDDDDKSVANRRDKSLRDTEFVEWRDLEAHLYRWSIDVVINVMLGTINDEIIPHALIHEFSEVVQKIFEYSVSLQAIPPEVADFFKINAWEEFVKVVNRTLELGNHIIDEAIEHCPRESGGLLNQFKDQGIEKEDIKRLFTDLIIAAGDTTSFATQWSLYLLAKNSDTQKIIKKSLIKENMETELVRGAVRETLRLYPPATFIGRITQETGIIGPYEIPAGTLALLSLYTAGRDLNHFSDPYEFLPQRWSRDSNNNHKSDPQASLPYAIGARSCIGRKIANYQMHTLLTKLLMKYDMKLLNENGVDSVMRMVITPKEKIRIGLKLKQ